MKTGEKLSLCLLLLIAFAGSVAAQELITNVYGRNIHSLNGKWNAIIDLYDQGQRMKIYENRQPEGNIDFYEYAFEGGLRLNVPGDWNSQSPELKYYEGTVWYARHFDAKRLADKRQFLYFGAVSYRSKVYLNGKEIAEHEGGFTPFQVEVTDLLKGIYTHNGLLYFHTEIKNQSNVPFDVDYITWKIVDKKVAKRTAVQEQIILPLRAQNYATLVPGKKSERTVFTMAKFTIPDDKCLVVELNEKNGGRHQSFVIENEDLVRAGTINELQVR